MFIYVGLQICASFCLPAIFQEKKMPTKHNEMPYVRRAIAFKMAYMTLLSYYFCRGPRIGSFIRAQGGGWCKKKKKAKKQNKI